MNADMDYREALNRTIEVFHLKAVDIAKTSGIEPGRLSKFRNGHNDLYAAALAKVISALPPEARAYYYLLVMGNGDKASGTADPSGKYAVEGK